MVQGKLYRGAMCVYVCVCTHVHSLIHAGMSDQVQGKDSFSNFKISLHKQNTVYFAVIDLILLLSPSLYNGETDN